MDSNQELVGDEYVPGSSLKEDISKGLKSMLSVSSIVGVVIGAFAGLLLFGFWKGWIVFAIIGGAIGFFIDWAFVKKNKFLRYNRRFWLLILVLLLIGWVSNLPALIVVPFILFNMSSATQAVFDLFPFAFYFLWLTPIMMIIALFLSGYQLNLNSKVVKIIIVFLASIPWIVRVVSWVLLSSQ